jgi:hypothetical protein
MNEQDFIVKQSTNLLLVPVAEDAHRCEVER